MFGATTPSYDREKDIDRRFPYEHISEEAVAEVLPSFLGTNEQIAPLFFFFSVDGVRAYEMARRMYKQSAGTSSGDFDAAALSILSRIDGELLDGVKRKSDFLRAAFRNAKGIESVSGMGLLLGLKTEKQASEVLAACRDRGVLCLSAKDKVRLAPALNIPDELLARAADVIKSVCAE